jgi:tRNA G10  N-methylase Trm11
MLPPKLAQIMINLAQINDQDALIIDPFCGSGTILSEAMLLGYRNLFASDISLKAVEDTRRNFNWTKEIYKVTESKLKLFTKNVLALSKFIKAESVAAIITEPYLGPQRNLQNIPTVIRDLEGLYSQAIGEFKKVLLPQGRVVMVWPLFYGQRPISPDFTGFKLLDMLPGEFIGSKLLKKNNRETIIYGRPGQRVYREIAVLEKL